MKRYIVIAFLGATLLQAAPAGKQAALANKNDQKLADLEKLVQERKLELPQLRTQLQKTSKGSEDARRLRTKINQYEEFITTAQAELKARRAVGTSQVPVTSPVTSSESKQSFMEELKQRVEGDFNLRPAEKQTPLKPKPESQLSSHEQLMQDIRKGKTLRSTAEQPELGKMEYPELETTE